MLGRLVKLFPQISQMNGFSPTERESEERRGGEEREKNQEKWGKLRKDCQIGTEIKEAEIEEARGEGERQGGRRGRWEGEMRG